MADKPTILPEWDTTEVNIVEPDVAHKDQGWLAPAGIPEKPPYQYFNWWQNLVYKWLDWINENVTALLTKVNASTQVGGAGEGDKLVETKPEGIIDVTLLPSSTDTTEGIVRQATDAEMIAGSDLNAFANPKQIKDNFDASVGQWTTVTTFYSGFNSNYGDDRTLKYRTIHGGKSVEIAGWVASTAAGPTAARLCDIPVAFDYSWECWTYEMSLWGSTPFQRPQAIQVNGNGSYITVWARDTDGSESGVRNSIVINLVISQKS